MDAAATIQCENCVSSLQARRPNFAIEVRLALVFTAVCVVGLACGLPINVPDGASAQFAQYHYFSPILMAFALQLPITWISARRNRSDPFLLLKLLPFLALVIFLHFNFKAWMPLINPNSYDDVYQGIDEFFWPLVTGFIWLRETIAGWLPFDADFAYHGLFVGMFFLSFSAHALFDTPVGQRRLVLGICLILLLGGICYWIAPAVGPFIYREGVNEESTAAQAHMLSLFNHVVQTAEIPPGYFVAPLAAMPSLHVAHALFFTLIAARTLPWLALAYLPILIWIVIGSVASGWHYLADLPVGALLSLLCLVMVRVLIPEDKIPPQPSAADRLD